MRILYVVQRYGERIIGGSEAACRGFAEALVAGGHHVEVLTSCAQSYVDWADEFQPGVEVINGVVVNRLPVVNPRRDSVFGPIHDHLMRDPSKSLRSEQLRWARLMGPELRGQRTWLFENSSRFDVAIFMTYLYASTVFGLPVLAGRIPTILQPTAHDELPAYVPLFQSIFRLPDSFLFFTEEERRTVQRIYGVEPSGKVVGIGINQPDAHGVGGNFRRLFGLGDFPYITYVGRLDASKGVGELIRFFRAFKERNDTTLKLVLVGDGDFDVPESSDVIKTGYVDEETKRNAISGALALVQPSYFESFSIVVCEAWMEARPALVQGHCTVLRGQAMRSRGAVPYEGFAEFEAALEMLINNSEISSLLGRNGKKYVSERYSWESVIKETESTIVSAMQRFERRRLLTRPAQ